MLPLRHTLFCADETREKKAGKPPPIMELAERDDDDTKIRKYQEQLSAIIEIKQRRE